MPDRKTAMAMKDLEAAECRGNIRTEAVAMETETAAVEEIMKHIMVTEDLIWMKTLYRDFCRPVVIRCITEAEKAEDRKESFPSWQKKNR